MKNVFTALVSAILLNGALAAVWDFDFDFTGYSKLAELLVTNCTTDIRNQINAVLCGNILIANTQYRHSNLMISFD